MAFTVVHHYVKEGFPGHLIVLVNLCGKDSLGQDQDEKRPYTTRAPEDVQHDWVRRL